MPLFPPPTAPSDGAITCSQLTKLYGSLAAVNGLTLTIRPGVIYGLLGPNGSGKSTFMRMVTGLTKPSYGSLRVLGRDPAAEPMAVKQFIGYVPETPILYDSLTPAEYFEFVGAARGLEPEAVSKRANELLRAFGIADRTQDFIGSLSFGTKQKVAIIGALLHEPQLFVLDEPLNGLDPKSARILKDLMRGFADSGRTVLFSTHILEVAEHVCDEVGILLRGGLVSQGSVARLREMVADSGASLEEIFFRVTGEEDLAGIISALRGTLIGQ